MADPRRLPVGSITVRADGNAWMKQAHGQDFKWLGEARASDAMPSAVPSAPPTPLGTPDLEGDTDVKPIHTWRDEQGVEYRTYSPAWFWAKAQFHNEQAKAHHEKLERAYHLAEVSLEASAHTSVPDAVICAHILTGHRLSDLLSVSTSSASASGVVKSFSAMPHPHRVTFVLKHPHGHVYPTYVVCDALSAYVAQQNEPHAPLFPTSYEEVAHRMEELGVGDVAPSDVRHIAARRIAADLLSKLPRPDLSRPDGLEKLKANLALASHEVAKRFGHDPSEGSFVHPSLAMAYAEMCNGAALWPNVFKSEGPCFPTMPESSSSEASSSTSPTPASSSGSMNSTSLPPTPTATQPPEGSKLQLPPSLLDGESPAPVDKSLTPSDHQRFARLMASFAPEKNWKIGKAIFKLSALARKARNGDLGALHALDDLLRLIQSDPSHGFDVAISKADDIPGPSGDPIGTISQHADGSVWEKREDGWHEVGQGKRELNAKQKMDAGGRGAASGQAPPLSRGNSAAYAQARAVMAKLKAMYEATSDMAERAVIAKQIALVRTRISALERAFDAGSPPPTSQTQPRDVSMSEALGSIFTELRARAGQFTSVDALCDYLCTSGSQVELSEFRALVEQYRDGAKDILKGWLK